MNGQPQPQRQITMRKINQEIAGRVPGSRRRTPLHPPRRSAGLPGRCVGGLAGQSWAPQGPARAGGLRRTGGRRSGEVPQQEVSHSGPATRSHASRRAHSPSTGFTRRPFLSPISAPVSAPPPRALPAFHSALPSSRPGAWVPIAAAAQTLRPQPATTPLQPGPRVAGGGNAAARGRPSWVAASGAEARGPSLLPPAASPTWFQLASAAGPPPLYPPELQKFATCSPGPRRGSARDSPPGCRRRCPVPGGSRLSAALSGGGKPEGPATRLGMGRPRSSGPRPSARRSRAVPTRARAR